MNYIQLQKKRKQSIKAFVRASARHIMIAKESKHMGFRCYLVPFLAFGLVEATDLLS